MNAFLPKKTSDLDIFHLINTHFWIFKRHLIAKLNEQNSYFKIYALVCPEVRLYVYHKIMLIVGLIYFIIITFVGG